MCNYGKFSRNILYPLVEQGTDKKSEIVFSKEVAMYLDALWFPRHQVYLHKYRLY